MKNLLSPLLLICFILFFSTGGFSQVPGYLGKRLLVEYSLESGLVLNSVSQNNRGFGKKLTSSGIARRNPSLGFNYAHNISISYAVLRSITLGITASQFHTGLVTIMESESTIEGDINYHHQLHRLSVNSIGMKFSQFYRSRGALAPIGEHYTIGFEKLWINGETIDQVVKTRYGHYEEININQELEYYAVSFGLGTNRVFSDRFIFKLGVVVRTIFDDEFVNSSFGIASSGGYPRNQEMYEHAVLGRLAKHNTMKFEIGLGILL